MSWHERKICVLLKMTNDSCPAVWTVNKPFEEVDDYCNGLKWSIKGSEYMLFTFRSTNWFRFLIYRHLSCWAGCSLEGTAVYSWRSKRTLLRTWHHDSRYPYLSEVVLFLKVLCKSLSCAAVHVEEVFGTSSLHNGTNQRGSPSPQLQ